MRRKSLLLLAALVACFSLWELSRSRTWQLFGEIVPRVETGRRVVALTFDDGPRNGVVEELTAVLARHGVKATFFVCGADLARERGAAEKLVAAGHELGNHSY